MDDKKRDLIPVAAIALFLVIIIALCAVRLHQRRETRTEIAETESTQIWYSEEQAESAESETKDAADQTEETTAGKKQTAERGQQKDETLTEHPDSKLPAGKGKESQGAKQEGTPRTVSGNDPLSGAESANKTNEEMLLEMSGYWEQDNMDAVEDLGDAALVYEDVVGYFGCKQFLLLWRAQQRRTAGRNRNRLLCG